MSHTRREYEEAFCKYVGTLGARAFGLGRQAMVILFKALGVNEGDKIGVCSFTCLSVVEAVKACGAIPVYLDVDEHFCIQSEQILQQKQGTVKVVILQHTFGVPGRLEQLLSACKNIRATVVEDCAHCLGCYWKGQPLGKFGAGAIYSFEWGKPYSTGQGGMLTVNSEEILRETNRLIKEQALRASIKSELILECERRLYPMLGSSRLKSYLQNKCKKLRNMSLCRCSSNSDTEFRFYRGYVRLAGTMTAKAGLKQLENWPKLMQLRRKNTEMIEEHLSKAGLALWPKPAEADVTMLRYPVPTPEKARVISQARKQKLDIAGWYESPVHPLKGNELSKVDYKIGSCQKAEDMIKRFVYLPTGLTLNRHKLEAMMGIICGS
jgi:perosamine synthetase